MTSYDDTTFRLDLDNEPQPDGLLHVDEDAGGQSPISDDDYVEGPPNRFQSRSTRSASIARKGLSAWA